ncbi:MAG TPA: LssY C-terminal domain-containing protein [Candidatus Saccharimonadales bacterium]|nr:LssY C-terminal domain-containing protein [Candidatus Saccharimonadales bacterium]
MTQYALRFAKRFAVLVPGIIIAFVSVRDIYPYFNRRLPLSVAIFLTYVLGAYVLVPAIIRLWRLIRPPDHLPLYCVTPDGFASDPLNIGIIGTQKQLVSAMKQAGWFVADPRHWRNLVRAALSTIYGWSYPNAPVSNLYLFGRKQDVAFEIPVEGVVSGRHHVRFWSTPHNDELLWVGAASQDVGVHFIRHNLQLTHLIDPDTNRERELIVKRLRAQKLVRKVEMIKLGEPYRLVNRVISGSLHTDGRMAVVTLRTKTTGPAGRGRSHR